MIPFHIFKLIVYDLLNIRGHRNDTIGRTGFQIIGKYEFGFFLLIIRIYSFYCCADIKVMSFKVYTIFKNCNLFLSDASRSQKLKDILKVSRKMRKQIDSS